MRCLRKKRLLAKSLLINLFFIRLNEPRNSNASEKTITLVNTWNYLLLFNRIVNRSFFYRLFTDFGTAMAPVYATGFIHRCVQFYIYNKSHSRPLNAPYW